VAAGQQKEWNEAQLHSDVLGQAVPTVLFGHAKRVTHSRHPSDNKVGGRVD